jgi:hypothetical protein
MLLAGQRQEKQQATSYKLGGSPCFIDPRVMISVCHEADTEKEKGLESLPSATARSP